MKAPDSQIAVTLYDLRDYCKTESDLDCTLDKVCAAGYQAVQVSGISLAPEVIKKQLDSHRLFCCAAHDGFGDLTGNVQRVIDKLKTLECDFTAPGCPPGEYRGTSYAKTQELVALMQKAGEKMLENGIRLGYHNHDYEFHKQDNGKTMLENYYDDSAALKPLALFAEIDVHWVVRGGDCPVRWIKKVGGRMPVVHFKDFVMYENQPHTCEIGMGNLDWQAIIKACRETNVRWYSIEQDHPFPGRDIFDSIKISFDNLRAMGVR